MNGFMRHGIVGLCLVGGLAAMGCTGGERYRNLVDPCQHERYSAAARQEVIQAFAPQVQNGHILNQTIWNDYFEPGTDKLHPGGRQKLDQIVQTRPQPDSKLFLATARDIDFRDGDADKFIEARRELNNKRVVTIQKYLGAQTADRPIPFEVLIHDPAPVGIPAISAYTAVSRQRINYSGGIGAIGGVGAAGGAGTATSITSSGVTVSGGASQGGAPQQGATQGGTGSAPPR